MILSYETLVFVCEFFVKYCSYSAFPLLKVLKLFVNLENKCAP